MNHSGGLLKEAYEAMSHRYSDKDGDIKEKSTKESNFVSEHKRNLFAKSQ